MTYDNSRLRRLALIALALQTAGRVEGRTKMQKMMYLANLLGWKAIDFKYHNYGPYSDTLASELESMRNYGWIQERQVGTSKDRTLHEYSFFPKQRQIGLSLVGKIREAGPESQKLVSRTQGLFKQLSAFSSDELEIMSTLMFLRTENASMSDGELVNEVHELKPQFGKEQITEGLRVFKIMRDFLPTATKPTH